jgi:cobalamin biosynthesis protein CbiD
MAALSPLGLSKPPSTALRFIAGEGVGTVIAGAFRAAWKPAINPTPRSMIQDAV